MLNTSNIFKERFIVIKSTVCFWKNWTYTRVYMVVYCWLVTKKVAFVRFGTFVIEEKMFVAKVSGWIQEQRNKYSYELI